MSWTPIANSEAEQIDENFDVEMCPEYDFSGGVQGRYYESFQQASNVVVVVLDPDVAELFKDSATVNEALRMLIKIAKSTRA